ncbi:MAG: hypothetical protein ACM3WV_11170 [Bacillota bacterium]
MKKRFLILPAVLLMVSGVIMLNLMAADLDASIDAGVTYQTIEGWGTCLYPNEHSDSASLYLDQRWRDAYRNLGLNLLRLNVEPNIFMAPGGTLEGPEVPLGSDLATNASKFNFEFPRFRYSDDLAVWLSQNALEPSRVKICASIWSVPHWAKAPTGTEIASGRWRGVTPLIMYCDTCDTAGGTWDTGIYMQDRYQYCARYMSAFCYGFEQYSGVPIHNLTIQNEVAYESPFNSGTLYHKAIAQKVKQDPQMDYNVYANALKAVKDEWAIRPEVQHIKIIGPHHAGLDETPANPWGLLFQTSGIQAVKDHSDPDLINFLSIYTNNYGAPAAQRAEMFRGYWEGIDSMPDEGWGSSWGGTPYFPPVMHQGIAGDGKQTWNSEMGGHNTDWPGAMDLASDMHTQLVWANQSALIYWQFCEDSNTVHNLMAASQLDNPVAAPKYRAFKHFSRYIRPGARRVKAVFSDGSTSYGTGNPMDAEQALDISAYVHDTDGRITIVLVNMRAEPYTLNIAVPASPSVTNYQVFRSSSTEQFVQLSDIPVSGGTVTITIPASSIVTLTGTGAGVEPTPTPSATPTPSPSIAPTPSATPAPTPTSSSGSAPGSFNLLYPANKAVNISRTPSFDWEDSDGASSYTIIVDNNSDFSSPEINTDGLTASSYISEVTLGSRTKYYWKVYAVNSSGATKCNNDFYFTTKP